MARLPPHIIAPERKKSESAEQYLFKHFLDEAHHRGREPHPTEVTDAVREFVAERYRPKSDDVRDKAKAIERMVEGVMHSFVWCRDNEARGLAYDTMTGHDYAKRGAGIPVPIGRGRRGKAPLWGCKTAVDVMLPLLKVAGAKNIKHVRTETDTHRAHSLVMFDLPGKFRDPKFGRAEDVTWTYLANPFPEAPLVDLMVEQDVPEKTLWNQKPMVQVGETVREEIERRKEKGMWREGKSSRELGLTWEDYQKKRRGERTGWLLE